MDPAHLAAKLSLSVTPKALEEREKDQGVVEQSVYLGDQTVYKTAEFL